MEKIQVIFYQFMEQDEMLYVMVGIFLVGFFLKTFENLYYDVLLERLENGTWRTQRWMKAFAQGADDTVHSEKRNKKNSEKNNGKHSEERNEKCDAMYSENNNENSNAMHNEKRNEEHNTMHNEERNEEHNTMHNEECNEVHNSMDNEECNEVHNSMHNEKCNEKRNGVCNTEAVVIWQTMKRSMHQWSVFGVPLEHMSEISDGMAAIILLMGVYAHLGASLTLGIMLIMWGKFLGSHNKQKVVLDELYYRVVTEHAWEARDRVKVVLNRKSGQAECEESDTELIPEQTECLLCNRQAEQKEDGVKTATNASTKASTMASTKSKVTNIFEKSKEQVFDEVMNEFLS